ncbi:MAG: diphthine--ammonia ligase [Methanomassiliicoccaceae archaeon]|nr:diphthine--ammonia ligase [Methanomassiliicoccaceae archaeon]
MMPVAVIMRLAALYSGGKDSTLALYLAQQMGYDVPYLVSIEPESGESWMFHVPNIGAVPLMAASMGKELVTVGTSGSEEADMQALSGALSGLDADGIVAGFVWSDYQWDRVNRVCDRIGMKVVAPLWRKDQGMALEELLSAGIRAVIVGCYAEGFDKSWLGREIDSAAVDGLMSLRDSHGISVIGEGGEYESLTLDSPMHSRPLHIVRHTLEWGRGGGTLLVDDAVLRDR